VMENRSEDMASPDLVTGNWVMRCEARTLDDIRALGGNDASDERRFATAARVSEINLSLYRTFAQPVVRALVNSSTAERMQTRHPLRVQYEIFSKANPLMGPIAGLADQVRKERKPAAKDNPFLAMQENVSRQIVAGLEAWREMTETLAERTFLAIYGLPSLQSAVGVDPAGTRPLRKAAKNPLHQELLQKRIAELKARIAVGGVREAIIRGVLYAGMDRAAIDERGFELARRIRQAHGDMPLAELKALVREQFNMLLIDQEAALKAIPEMLPADAATRHKAFGLIRQVLAARGEMSAQDQERLMAVGHLFGVDEEVPLVPAPTRQIRKERQGRVLR